MSDKRNNTKVEIFVATCHRCLQWLPDLNPPSMAVAHNVASNTVVAFVACSVNAPIIYF